MKKFLYDYIIEKHFAAFEIKALINYKFDSFSNNNAGGIIINNIFLINIFHYLNQVFFFERKNNRNIKLEHIIFNLSGYILITTYKFGEEIFLNI